MNIKQIMGVPVFIKRATHGYENNENIVLIIVSVLRAGIRCAVLYVLDLSGTASTGKIQLRSLERCEVFDTFLCKKSMLL